MLPSSDEGGVAFFAHIGGFGVEQMALVPFFKKPNVEAVFPPSRSRPFEVEHRPRPLGLTDMGGVAMLSEHRRTSFFRKKA